MCGQWTKNWTGNCRNTNPTRDRIRVHRSEGTGKGGK